MSHNLTFFVIKKPKKIRIARLEGDLILLKRHLIIFFEQILNPIVTKSLLKKRHSAANLKKFKYHLSILSLIRK